ncbi:uncharacterized protein LOC143238692 isoform X2 [Tachypleus tridentatus]|uniref:uncharacterized protein LOC143238692 isoform X2 n=1 Tax=Tachypleus tridentatus TaxID=6853 RepID=UPI003FCF17B9
MTKEPDKKLPMTNNTIRILKTSTSNWSSSEPEPFPENEENFTDLEWSPEDLANIPEPPDGGWGWMIVLASFLCNAVVDGISYSFGIFLMEFVHYYDASKFKTAWIGSLLSGGYMSSGIGFGLIYLPAIVSVSMYFTTKRGLATGIAVSGSGVGAFVVAPVCQKLLELYNWRGVLLILSGLSLNCAVFGALMRPLKPSCSPKVKPLLQRIAEEKEQHRSDLLCNSQYILVQTQDGNFEKFPLHNGELHGQDVYSSIIDTETGVHSNMNLEDDLYYRDPPFLTLSPIEEIRKSPSSSKENEGNIKTVKNKKTSSCSSKKRSRSLSDVTVHLLANTGFKTLSIDIFPHGVFCNKEICCNNNRIIQTYNNPSNAFTQIFRGKRLGNNVNEMTMCLSSLDVDNQTLDKWRQFDVFPRSTLYQNKVHHGALDKPLNRFISENLTTNASQNSSLRPPSCVIISGNSQRSSLRSHKSSVKYDRRDLLRPLYRKDIFYSGSIVHLPQYRQSQGEVRSYMASVTSIPQKTSRVDTLPDLVEEKTKRIWTCLRFSNSFTSAIRELLNFSLLKNPVFFLLCIANVLGMMGFYIPFVFISDSSVVKGVSREKSAFLLSIIGIMNTLGRFFFGWLADRTKISSLLVNNICLILAGISVFIMPFCVSYITIVASCICFGLFISAYISLTSIIIVDILGLDLLSNAFGLLCLFRGLSTILGPPLVGSMYDFTGSYDTPFFVAGSLLVCSAILTVWVPHVSCWTVQNHTKVLGPEQPTSATCVV